MSNLGLLASQESKNPNPNPNLTLECQYKKIGSKVTVILEIWDDLQVHWDPLRILNQEHQEPNPELPDKEYRVKGQACLRDVGPLAGLPKHIHKGQLWDQLKIPMDPSRRSNVKIKP